MASNDIGDEGTQALKGLVKLTDLDLARTRIGDEGMQVFKSLVNLTSLDVAGNEIWEQGGAGAQRSREPHLPQAS